MYTAYSICVRITSIGNPGISRNKYVKWNKINSILIYRPLFPTNIRSFCSAIGTEPRINECAESDVNA